MHLKSAIAVAVISFGLIVFVKALPMDEFYDEFEDTKDLSKRGVQQVRRRQSYPCTLLSLLIGGGGRCASKTLEPCVFDATECIQFLIMRIPSMHSR